MVATKPDVPEPERSDADSPDSAALQLRASDDERQRVVEVLGEHAAVGRITLSELEERVSKAYAASTRADLAELTTDLPALPEPSTVREATRLKPGSRGRKPTSWFLAVMGGSTRRAKRYAGRLNVLAVMGGDDLDLRETEIEGDELVINVFAVMGGAAVYLPDSVEVELSGLAIMGGHDERGSTRSPTPGAPVVRIRSFALMGGVDVWRVPAEARTLRLKEARRIAKAVERDRRQIER